MSVVQWLRTPLSWPVLIALAGCAGSTAPAAPEGAEHATDHVAFAQSPGPGKETGKRSGKRARLHKSPELAPDSAEPAPKPPPADPNTARIQVIGLSDFHGWLLPLEPKGYARYHGGIANLGGMLAHKEQLDPARSIILDNGDMWTGPSESTLLRGESVVQAYNALGMAAANVANHEFDFGLEILRARAAEAKFPFLGANIYRAGTNEHPDFLKPYVIVERDGVKVAVIGLSYIDTPKTTLAKHVADLEFRGYAETLAQVVPGAIAEGAEVIVVLFHDEAEIVKKVIEGLPDLQIDAVIAGQNHRKESTTAGRTPVVNPGPFGRSYVRFDVAVNRASRKVESVGHEVVDVTGEVGAPPYAPDTELTTIAEAARQKATTLTQEELGRLTKPLPRGTYQNTPLGHFVVDAWLDAFNFADLAILNFGAVRQPLGSGKITVGDLMSVMPFENNLYIVRLTGAQIQEQLKISEPVVAGISWSYREKKEGQRDIVSVVDRLGRPLKKDQKYKILILDFMYTGGDGYTFAKFDTTPVDTGLSWREPVMRKLRLAESTGRKLEPQSSARARKVK